MSWNSKYSVNTLIEDINSGRYGNPDTGICIPSRHHNSLSEDIEALNDKVRYYKGSRKFGTWTQADEFLMNRIGTKVNYEHIRNRWHDYPKEKIIGRYSSPLVRSELKKAQSALTEEDLLKGVNKIEEACDFRGTTIKSLPDLNSIGGNLILDTNSQLEKLENLKHVEGKIRVVARDKNEMIEYLQKLGLGYEYHKDYYWNEKEYYNQFGLIMRDYI